MTPEQETWHREVAMQCNNRAWALSVQPRTSAEDAELLTAAHTSAYHWARVGTELNRMRATMLLAEAHALLRHGATALAYATAMRDFFLGTADTPDWEVAFAHTIHAHAASVAGDRAQHRQSYGAAEAALAAIADPEDRAIVEETFAHVPAPDEPLDR